jgi:hypothetical protein
LKISNPEVDLTTRSSTGSLSGKVGKAVLRLLGAAVMILVLTGSLCIIPEKYSPSMSDIIGPSTGVVGQTLRYSVFASGPREEDVAVLFDWDDGTPLIWQPFNPSGTEVVVYHTFAHEGLYTVQVKAGSRDGDKSDWFCTLDVDIQAARK